MQFSMVNSAAMSHLPTTRRPRVRLTRVGEQERVSGSLWVFAGHVGDVQGDPQAGDLVDVYTARGRWHARGFYNPHSKIRIRLLTLEDEPIDEAFWTHRIQRAVALRRRLVSETNAYRLVHGEADLLPGLVVDHYDDVLVMQTLSAGVDRIKDALADALTAQTGVGSIYLRNDAKVRTQEGLPLEKGFLRQPGPTRREIFEGPATFLVDIERGQKTGWFCDQRENRLAASLLAVGGTVLDVFCHTGAFGIHAGLRGAASVDGIDASQDSLALARTHAERNKVEALCTYRGVDAFDELKRLDGAGRRYQLVILDPPAFARSRQAVTHALAGYKDINLRALRLLEQDGFLVSCSCSHHVSEAQFLETIVAAARDAKRQIRLIQQRGAGPDHPILATMPETRYLKCVIAQVL